MKHKKFQYRCPQCGETGLQPDLEAAYKVRICETCHGRGNALLTVAEWIELDETIHQTLQVSAFRMPTFDADGPRQEPPVAGRSVEDKSFAVNRNSRRKYGTGVCRGRSARVLLRKA